MEYAARLSYGRNYRYRVRDQQEQLRNVKFVNDNDDDEFDDSNHNTYHIPLAEMVKDNLRPDWFDEFVDVEPKEPKENKGPAKNASEKAKLRAKYLKELKKWEEEKRLWEERTVIFN
jgi:hypothetical protein